MSAGGYTFWMHTLLRLETAQPTQDPAKPAPEASPNPARSMQHSTQVTAQPQLIDMMLDVVCDMIYVGSTHLSLSASAESAYTNTPAGAASHTHGGHAAHHNEPATPSLLGSTTASNAVRNIEAFTVLQNYFMQSSQPAARIKVLIPSSLLHLFFFFS